MTIAIFCRCSLIRSLKEIHWMSRKWPWIQQRIPYVLISQSPKFHSVSLYDKRFRVTVHVGTSALIDPEMTLNTYWVKGDVYVWAVSLSQKFQTISFYGNLWLILRDKCTEGPQNDLENYEVKGVLYISSNGTPEFQIAACLTPWLNIYKII